MTHGVNIEINKRIQNKRMKYVKYMKGALLINELRKYEVFLIKFAFVDTCSLFFITILIVEYQ
jgi:hypothetical protein